MDNLTGAARGAGMFGGLANVFGSQAGQEAIGLMLSPMGRLQNAAKQEGSLDAVKKDFEDYARFSAATWKYMLSVNYANRPAGAKLLTNMLEGTQPPGFDKMDPKTKEEFLKKQVPVILETLASAEVGAGYPPVGGAARAGMKPALEQRLGAAGVPEELYKPAGFEAWGPKTKGRYFGTIRGKELAREPITTVTGAEAMLSGKTLGEVPVTYVEFQNAKSDLFRDLPSDDKPVVALLSEGAGAAVTEVGWWVGDKAATEKMETKHPFLKDTRTAGILKVEATSEGLVNWTKFTTENIENASPDEKMDAWTFLLKYGNLSKQSMWYIFFNWFGGKGVPKQPSYWPRLGGTK